MAGISRTVLMDGVPEADSPIMQTQAHRVGRAGGTPYMNMVLTVIAGLLAVLAVDRRPDGAPGGPSVALAQPGKSNGSPGDQAGLISALEQRKIMIASLARIEERLTKMEAKLSSGISVKVTEMPAVRMQGDKDKPKDAGDKGAATK